MDENKSHGNTAKIRKEAAKFLNILKKEENGLQMLHSKKKCWPTKEQGKNRDFAFIEWIKNARKTQTEPFNINNLKLWLQNGAFAVFTRKKKTSQNLTFRNKIKPEFLNALKKKSDFLGSIKKGSLFKVKWNKWAFMNVFISYKKEK